MKKKNAEKDSDIDLGETATFDLAARISKSVEEAEDIEDVEDMKDAEPALAATEDTDAPKKGKYWGGGSIRITRSLYDKMLEAYKERPSVGFVREATGVGKFMAKRAIHRGWPEMGLPAFTSILAIGFSKNNPKKKRQDELALAKDPFYEDPLSTHTAAKQAADEAFAARSVMRAAMKSLRLNMMVADQLLQQFEMGLIPLPENVTPKMIAQITRSMDSAASIAQKAIDIERKRIGVPERAMGMQIGEMLDSLTDEELYEIERSGTLPSRLITKRPAPPEKHPDAIEVPFAERFPKVQERFAAGTTRGETGKEETGETTDFALPDAAPPPGFVEERLDEEEGSDVDTEGAFPTESWRSDTGQDS